MNPFAAVEPIGAARGPLATLQALADALAGPAPQPMTGEVGGAMHGSAAGPVNELWGGLQSGLQSGPASGLNYAPADVTKSDLSNALMNEPAPARLPLSDAIPAAVTTAQAMQGRITLGQLAAEPTALRRATEMSVGASAAEAARGAPISTLAPESGATARAPITLAVPVLLTPTFATPGQAARAHEGPDSPAARQRDADRQRRSPEPDDGCADGPLEDATTAPESAADNTGAGPESDADASPSCDPEAAALRALLQHAEQLEALRELALGRRVLVLLPQADGGHGAAPAAAALLTSDSVQHFGARWWPGTANAVRPGWLRWRVFRSGEPQLDSGLRSRSASTACHLRLGPHAPHLTDAGTAQVELAERIRFTQALGAQWSLLVIAAPPGAFA